MKKWNVLSAYKKTRLKFAYALNAMAQKFLNVMIRNAEQVICLNLTNFNTLTIKFVSIMRIQKSDTKKCDRIF